MVQYVWIERPQFLLSGVLVLIEAVRPIKALMVVECAERYHILIAML